jgi:hypothetical protein
MIQELDVVVLKRDLPEHGLETGDAGTVVLVYGGGEAFEVEFVTADGYTAALLTLDAENVEPLNGRQLVPRPIGDTELSHVRRLTPASGSDLNVRSEREAWE